MIKKYLPWFLTAGLLAVLVLILVKVRPQKLDPALQNQYQNNYAQAPYLTPPQLPGTPPDLYVPNQNQTIEEKEYARIPQLRISGGKEYYGSGGVIALSAYDEPVVDMVTYNLNGEAKVEVYEANLPAMLEFLSHDEKNNQLKKSTDTKNFRLIKTFSKNVYQAGGGPQRVTLPISESGIWFLKIQVGDQSDRAFVIRSKTATLVKQAQDKFVFWTQDLGSGRSVKSGDVYLYNLKSAVKQLEDAKISENGTAEARFSEDADVAIVQSGGDINLVPINLQSLNQDYAYQPFADRKMNKYFLFTDRPVYLPGDKVDFKAIVRGDNDGSYSLPSGLWQVKVFRDWNENDAIFEKTYSTSGLGALSGEINLAKDIKPGQYTMKVSPAGKTPDYNWSDSNYVSFQVEYYRKPEYHLDISLTSAEIVRGEKLSAKIKGEYFFGQPLAGKKVRYAVYSSPMYGYEYQSDFNYELNDDYRYNYWYGSNKLKEDEVTLNDKGEGEIFYDTSDANLQGQAQIFTIEAEYTDETQNPSFARKNILVFPGLFGIYRADTYLNYAKAGQVYGLPVVLKGAQNNSVSNVEITANITRQWWDSYTPPGQKYAVWNSHSEDLPEIKLTTDSQGKALLRFNVKEQGSYTVNVQARDKKNNLVVKQFNVWASDNTGYWYWYGEGSSGGLSVKADKEKYKLSEKAVLNISSKIPNRDVLLTLERGGVNRYQVVSLQGKTGQTEVAFENTDLPNIFASVSSFGKNWLDTGEAKLTLDSSEKKLSVTVTPQSQKYGPGETVTLNVDTKDSAGNPVPAEVAVWAVDKSIYELAQTNLGDIFQRFWGERYNSTITNNSLNGVYVFGGAEKGGCFTADTLITMSDGSQKAIKDIKPGESVRTLASSRGEIVSGKVTEVTRAKVNGYLIINRDLKITANHKLFVNGSWQTAGNIQIGDFLLDQNGGKKTVESIEWQAGLADVYNLSVENYHTFIAQNTWVHNQKGGNGGARGIFKDTAYWNPRVNTDFFGHASVSFVLPDNLTTWVISGVGIDADMRVGQIKKEFLVTKEVIIRPVLPNILHTGDSIKLSAIVQNYTELDQEFEVSLKIAGVEIKNQPEASVIEAKGFKEFYWDVKVPGDLKKLALSYSALPKLTPKLSDRLNMSVPVLPFGFLDQRAEVGQGEKTYFVKLSPDTDAKNSKISVSFAPSLLGTLPSAMKYLVDYPYGCIEQTISRFAPAIIAKQNPELFKEALKDRDLDAIIKQGVTRIKLLQNPDGGWGWWHLGNSDPYISAYVAEYLLAARDLGYTVDAGVLLGATNFLKGPASANPQAPPDNSQNASRFYGLSLFDPKLASTTFTGFANLTPDVTAMAVVAADKNKNDQRVLDIYNEGLRILRSSAKYEGSRAYWESGSSWNFGSRDASTAWAIRALITSQDQQDKDLAQKATLYLLDNRRSEYWSNTYATSRVIRAVVDFAKNQNNLSPNYAYTISLDGKVLKSGRVANYYDNISLAIPAEKIKAEGSQIFIQKTGDGQLYSTLVISEFRTDPKAAPISRGITVSREIENKLGGNVIRVGDVAVVRIWIEGLSSDSNYGVLEDQLPAGLVPINKGLNNEQFGDSGYGYNWYPGYYGYSAGEVTQNGMIFSFYNYEQSRQVFEYEARAVAEGEFIAPPAVSSLMYKPDVYGRSEIKTVKIVPSGVEIPKVVVAGAPNFSEFTRQIKQNKLGFIVVPVALLMLILAAGIIYRKQKRAAQKLRESAPENVTPDDKQE